MSAQIQHHAATAQALKAQGWPQAAIARHLGLSAPTLCRLLARVAAGEELGPRHATGPRDSHQLTQDEQAVATLAMLQKSSRRLAALMMLESSHCSAETAVRLQEVLDRAAETRSAERWPTWWVRACHLTQEQRAAFRGPKALAALEPARPRGRFWVDAEGKKHAMFPNALWEFDDESENTPRVEIDQNGVARVNRQTLKAIDYDSAFYLGTRNISRASDGYRLADQADFLLELVDCYGLPMRCRIERGPWDNSFWFGVAMPQRWWQTPECATYRFGGIDVDAGGPIKVLQAFKSRQKGLIEGSFNFRQNIGAHKTTDMGRYRGEHEGTAKLLRQVQNLKDRERQARAAEHFPDSATAADISLENLDQFNALAKHRPHYWGRERLVPAEVYAAANKRELATSDRWRFLPVKTAATMSRSILSLQVKDYALPFVFSAEGHVPEWDWHGYVPAGWRVFACFHPERPDLGCHIFSAMHPEHPQNPRRLPLGLPMGVLPCVETPAFSDRPGDFADRKKTQAAYSAETRLATRAGKSVRVSTVVADGRSRVVRVGSADPLRQLSTAPAAPTPERTAEDVRQLAEIETARAARVAELAKLEAEMDPF